MRRWYVINIIATGVKFWSNDISVLCGFIQNIKRQMTVSCYSQIKVSLMWKRRFITCMDSVRVKAGERQAVEMCIAQDREFLSVAVQQRRVQR